MYQGLNVPEGFTFWKTEGLDEGAWCHHQECTVEDPDKDAKENLYMQEEFMVQAGCAYRTHNAEGNTIMKDHWHCDQCLASEQNIEVAKKYFREKKLEKINED